MKASTIVLIVSVLAGVSLTGLFLFLAYNQITMFVETVSNQAVLQSYIERSYSIDSMNEYVISSAIGFLMCIVLSLFGIKTIKDYITLVIDK